MRRRHLPEVLAIEAQVYPRPWTSRLFEDELVQYDVKEGPKGLQAINVVRMQQTG